MIERPIISGRILPFNAKHDYVFKFRVNSDVQITQHNIVIENPRTNEEVYNSTKISFVNEHIIPAGTLQNSKDYQVKVRVGNDKLWSEFSDLNYFKCLDEASIKITNIDYENGNKIYNQNITFVAEYTHPNNEPVNTYQFILYDYSGNIIKTYDRKTTDGEISQYVEELENDVIYSIEVAVETVNEATYSSGRIQFTPDYIKPNLSAIVDPINIPEMGAMLVNAKLVQIIGKLYDYDGNLYDLDDIEYVDNEWIDLTRDDYAKLVFDQGFIVEDNNWTIQLWLKNIPNMVDFLHLHCPDGYVKVCRYENKILAHKSNYYDYSKLARFISDDFEYSDDIEYILTLRQEQDRIDIWIEEYGGD